MATRTAIVEGDRNVLITAPTNNALIVTGDRNTVEMTLDGAGALLAFAFRWNRPKPRRRGDRPKPPACFDLHVDRDVEVLALAVADDPPRVVNVYGDRGIGKTHVLVEALNRRECEMRDGTVYLDGRGRDADDLLHAAFEALFETRIPLRDMQIEHHLKDRRALLALENVELAPDGAQRLVLGAPGSRLIVTSRERVLFDGVALRIEGLPSEHAVAIAEQELGRILTGRERAAAASVADGLRGHPLQLRQTFSRARDAGLNIEQLAPRAASAYDRAQALSAQERDVARVLAVHGDAPLGSEHIEALAGAGASAAAEALEARHEARSHSPRYSLAGDLAEALDDGSALAGEIDHALTYFTAWARDEARAGRRDRVLPESAALVALLERAQAAGRHDDVVALGVAIEGALALGNRWAAWKRVLELVLTAAQATGDSAVEAAALHQLGTRAYATGDARGAARLLEQALALRERIGDRAGAGVTRQNLRVVGGGPPLLYRLSHLSLAVVAAVVAVLAIGAGAAGAGVLGGGGDRGGPVDGGAQQSRLTVAVSGPGTVAGADGKINCKPRCQAGLDAGAEVVLEADPDERAEFKGWSGACTGLGRCRVPLDTDATVSATFATLSDPQLLSVRISGAGTVASKPAGIDCPRECSESFAAGRKVQLYATRRAGSSFAGWTGGSCDGSTQRRCDVTMNGPRSIAARFTTDQTTPAERATLTIEPSGQGSGTVTGAGGLRCPPDCSKAFRRGTTVQLKAVAHAGSRFAGWGRACDGADTTCEVPLEDDMTVRPVFERTGRGVELVVSIVDPGHGFVTSEPRGLRCRPATCSGVFARGTVTLSAQATDEGWRFAGWKGASCEGTGECRVPLDARTVVTALFERIMHTLTTVAEGNGTILADRRDCQTGCEFPAGSTVNLQSTPDPGHYQEGWTGCDPPQDAPGCTVTMDSKRTVTARFYPYAR